LALGAAGAGWNVFIGQFVEGMRYSELAILERLSDHITIRQFGRTCFINQTPGQADLRLAEESRPSAAASGSGR
jgi:cob(I)alamin adenosyltransferase